MKSVWTAVVIVVLPVIATTALSSVSPSEGSLPESALVVVVSRYFNGQGGGNGFVVGDGTLVVTCDHNIYEHSQKGGHRFEGFVAVFSPYLGQACDARILASDEELDLAVLKVPWRGHPSLPLADANAVMDTRRGRIVGLAAVVKRLEDWDSVGSAESFEVQGEELSVDFVAVRERVPRFIALKGTGQVGPGWSGSPIVVPGTATAVGCFNIIHGSRRDGQAFDQQAVGPVVCPLYRLLDGDFDRTRLNPVDTPLESPQDAHAACSFALQASTLLRPDKYASALESARAYIRLRPQSGFGHKMLAYASEKLGQTDAARESYRRAVELDPNSLHVQLLYAQFLADNGDPNGAGHILEPLWRAGKSRGLVAIGMVNLLNAQKEFARGIEILDVATQAEPKNAYLWQLMAVCQGQMRGPVAAIEPLTRAVELRPQEGPPRGTLARVLEMTGRLDEAEEHFRTLLDVEPGSPVVHCWLAQFLSKHRPAAMQEALKTAEKALELPPQMSLPREEIERLVAEIRGQIETSPQN